MATQASKAALKQLEKTEFLVSSIRTQQSTVNQRLGQISHEVLSDGEGEPPQAPDWDFLQRHNVLMLEASAAEVRRTDRLHRLNLVRDGRLRQGRREEVAGLRSGHGDLRQSFTGTYGEVSLPLVGLDAPAQRPFLALREQMLEVVDRMRDPDLAARLPAPRTGQSAIALVTLADAREADISHLGETMEAIKRMRKRLDESLLAKRAAQDRHRRVYSNIAKVQEGLYRLAGLDDLADRIRVTVRAPRKKEDKTPKEGQSTETAETAETTEQSEPAEAAETVGESAAS